MLIQLEPHNIIKVNSELSKREFFHQIGNPKDYNEICERCPLINKIYKSEQYSLGYFCHRCATQTDPNSPLERLLYGSILTEESFNLINQKRFHGDHFEAHEHALSPIELQHQVNFEDSFNSRYTIIDLAFHLWKLVYTVDQISEVKEIEIEHGETIWRSMEQKDEFQKAYVTIASYAIYCDGHNFHERTKEQAARDRSIDRKLQQMGWHVFRFTGSEIYNSLNKCIATITKQIAIDIANNQQLIFAAK